jgi:hypothetical protein
MHLIRNWLLTLGVTIPLDQADMLRRDGAGDFNSN